MLLWFKVSYKNGFPGVGSWEEMGTEQRVIYGFAGWAEFCGSS